MAEIKVLALDLDGTLTNDQKEVTPRTRAALDAANLQRMRIKLHALHAVGLDSHAVRCQQHVGNVLTVGAAVAIAGKNFHGQVPETLIIKITVSHS